jgi:hypothetical protein
MSLTATASVRRIPGVLVAVAIAAAILLAVALLPPVSEPQRFQSFADSRTIFGIANFMNVASNVPFLIVGLWGLWFLARHAGDGRVFADPREQWPYIVCFTAVALTAFGSSYYHLDVDGGTLFWDRLPMAFGFMGLFAAIIAERIDARLGRLLLVPLVLFGAGSVLYWRLTGNLLPYGLVQYGSIAAILVLCAIYRPRYTRGADVVHVIAIYALAKVAEVLDARIYAFGEVVSGHTLKHLIAAVATYWILRMLQLRSVLPVRS